jgi:hypothetical protein
MKYSKQAKDAAAVAVKKVPYPSGSLIESEIHIYLEEQLGMDRMGNEIDVVGDEALSVAGILLGLGPDSL